MISYALLQILYFSFSIQLYVTPFKFNRKSSIAVLTRALYHFKFSISTLYLPYQYPNNTFFDNFDVNEVALHDKSISEAKGMRKLSLN